jgi:ATP-dependent protease ClpP protease subunit
MQANDSSNMTNMSAYTIFSTNNNEIYFTGSINRVSMTELVRELKLCEQREFIKIDKHKFFVKTHLNALPENSKKLFTTNEKEIEVLPIKLIINSYGGSVHDVLFAVDQIRNLKIQVNTVVCGVAASAATVLSLVGKKRSITKHSQMLIHEIRYGYPWSKKTQLMDEHENMSKISELLVKYYTENTKITREELLKILERDRYWNATECLEKGLVDEII